MTFYRYIGDFPEGKESLDCWGYVFKAGAVIELHGHAAAKAAGNPFFEAVAVQDPVQESTDATETPDLYEGLDKVALLALAQARGVEIDGRWREKRILQALKDAENNG